MRIFFLLILTLVTSQAFSQNDYLKPVNNLLKTYPKATLQDIYKSFFQGYFGPEHLISDTLSVRNYLINELEVNDTTSLPYYEPVGMGDKFIRLSLSSIKDGYLTEEEVLFAFIESANNVEKPSLDLWKEEWKKILLVIPQTLPDFETDKKNIENLLSSGRYASHHSKQFNEYYHPHYRLISKKIFEERFKDRLPAME